MGNHEEKSKDQLERVKLSQEIECLEKKIKDSKKKPSNLDKFFTILDRFKALLMVIVILLGLWVTWTDLRKSFKTSIDSNRVNLAIKLSDDNETIRKNAAYMLSTYGDDVIVLLIKNIGWAKDVDTVDAISDSLKLIQQDSAKNNRAVWDMLLATTKERFAYELKTNYKEDTYISLKWYMFALASLSEKPQRKCVITLFTNEENKITGANGIATSHKTSMKEHFNTAKKRIPKF